ncbi:hypothetical protein C7450_103273 [Chelatococcus asaccharovorans]|uniref:Lipoprotein n=1 Tax=Chelatococcus asaccharovorans TaxID=28210 RepID=A0A2V3UB90_9HYPH|nr:hypothetical protein C7450_103273 [Chelatococcus asaccharovorans]
MHLNRLALIVAISIAATACQSTNPRGGGFSRSGPPDYVEDQLDNAVSPFPEDDRYGDDSLVPEVGGPM